ncbi:MAG: hypothetical protein Q9166_005246 [cf. Caloplaca sp. 2 TL-2023]
MAMGTSTMGGMAMGTATSMMPTTTAAMSGSMDMGMGMGSSKCKISVSRLSPISLQDAMELEHHRCFWHITSKGMFAGSCIGVIALVCMLEFLRRLSREFDRYILTGSARGVLVPFVARTPAAASQMRDEDQEISKSTHRVLERSGGGSQSSGDNVEEIHHHNIPHLLQRPSVLQQLARAVLHMLQFGLAYFIMLLAMYYNGYLIICIFLGALIGFFVFSWDIKPYDSKDALSVTGCCG